MTRRNYDIFEKFSDGSTLWKARVRGRFEAQRKINELAEHSDNHFYMLDIQDLFLAQPAPIKSKARAKTA